MIPDDAPVDDGTHLYRRIHPTEIFWDASKGVLRPTTAAFRKHDLSIHLGDVLADLSRSPASVVAEKPTYSLVHFTAAFARSEEQTVTRKAREGEPCHGEVIGEKKRARQRKFVDAALWDVCRPEFAPAHVRASMEQAGGAASNTIAKAV